MNNWHEHMTQPSLLRRLLFAALTGCALTLAAVGTPIVIGALTPAQAQITAEFRSALDPYRAWVRHPRWGEVWVPDDVSPDWRPYTYGHWIYTDEWGWYWVSDEQEEDWGWIIYHYGRWAHDRRLGWFWVPGDEWGPAWVDWRRGDDYVGWAPLPPDDVIEEYDDEPTYWVFLRPRYMLAPRLHRYFLSRARRTIVIRNTVVINRTIVVEHRRNGRARFAVNAGVSPAIVAAARRTAVPTFRVNPHVLPGTRNVVGAAVIRPQDLKRRPGQRQLAPRIARTNATVQPATTVVKPRPLGKNERGRLGSHPPRAARGAIVTPATTAPAIKPQKQLAPSSSAPRTAPPPHVTAPRQVKPERKAAPPSPQIKPQPKTLTAPPPSRVKPSQPAPRKQEVRPPVKRSAPAPAVRKAPPAPAVRKAPPAPAVRHAPPQQPRVQRRPPQHAPAAPRVTPRPQAPRPAPKQVHRPPPAHRPAPAQVRKPPPTHKPAPAQAKKPPPKKPGEKDNKEKK